MPEPFARSGQERQLVTAIMHVQAGRTMAESVDYMTGQYNLMSVQEASNLYRRAEQAVSQGRIMTEQIEELSEGIPDTPIATAARDREAVVIVEITTPDGMKDVRQIRVRIPGGSSLAGMMGEVDSVIDSWLNRYGTDGRVAVWEVAYVI